jgi:tetratricopeptide (TPR) repeat protein
MKYANYIVAKAFSFGLAWASYQSGELQRALGAAAAGSALLETSNDLVHRAYAHVMYAQILAATIRPVRDGSRPPAELDEAISLLTPITTREKSPLTAVPKLLARAQYVLGHVYFLAGKYREAEELARRPSWLSWHRRENFAPHS